MPRARLSNVSLKQLVAELDRRKRKLASLVVQRDAMDKEIAELQAMEGLAPAAAAPAAKKVQRGGRRRQRGTYAKTANEMILGLMGGGKSRSTADINAAWKADGRPGRADTALNKLLKSKKIVRTVVKGTRGSKYSLA